MINSLRHGSRQVGGGGVNLVGSRGGEHRGRVKDNNTEQLAPRRYNSTQRARRKGKQNRVIGLYLTHCLLHHNNAVLSHWPALAYNIRRRLLRNQP